jgi:hypothetical protein
MTTHTARFLAVVADSLDLVQQHLDLVSHNQVAAEHLAVDFDALTATVTSQAGGVALLSALTRVVRDVRLQAEAARDASAVALRRREDLLLQLRDRWATRAAARR